MLVHTVDAKFAPLWILQRQKTTSAFSIFVWLCLKNDKHTDSPKHQENLSSTHIANVWVRLECTSTNMITETHRLSPASGYRGEPGEQGEEVELISLTRHSCKIVSAGQIVTLYYGSPVVYEGAFPLPSGVYINQYDHRNPSHTQAIPCIRV